MQHCPIRRLQPNDQALSEVLTLIRTSFASMTGASIRPVRCTNSRYKTCQIRRKQVGSWLWATRWRPVKWPALYRMRSILAKWRWDAILRGQGVGRLLVAACAEIAREMGHDRLELQVRIELVENQQAFAKIGFVKVSENCHPGYGCVTEITMQKILSAVKPSKL